MPHNNPTPNAIQLSNSSETFALLANGGSLLFCEHQYTNVL